MERGDGERCWREVLERGVADSGVGKGCWRESGVGESGVEGRYGERCCKDVMETGVGKLYLSLVSEKCWREVLRT